MRLDQLRLTHFTPRGLNMLGYVFGSSDCRIVLTARAEVPVTVMIANRTLMLDPNKSGLFDLALGVRLLNHPELRKYRNSDAPEDGEDTDERMTALARETLARKCVRTLHREYPASRHLHGRFQALRTDFDGLRVTRRSGSLTPLPKLDPGAGGGTGGGGPIPTTHLDFTSIPDIDLMGAGDDFAWLLDGLKTGALPTYTLPQLEDLPFVRIPFEARDSNVFAGLEWLEEQLASEASKESIRSLMNCFQQKSEVRDERLHDGRRTASGTRMDPSRLVEAAVGARVGLQPKLFRKKGSYVEPVFDPSEHLAVMALDLSDIWQSRGDADRFITNLATVYERLGISLEIVAYAGRVATLADGRQVYLHFVTTLKPHDRPMDEGLWGRILRTLRTPMDLPGEPAWFHPVAFQDIARSIERVGRSETHSYRAVLWWARRWMRGRYDNPEFLIRAADSVDFQVRELRRTVDGTLDTLGCFLPERLKSHGRPEEFLRGVQTP